jgi:hemerythrin-like metal-binding protein
MEIISWNEKFSVKIKSIDDQHKKLFELINNFYNGFDQNSVKERTIELLTGLKNYTLFHFNTEEKYMKNFKFPGFENHKVEHDKFISTIMDYEKRHKEGKLLLTIEITSFIKDWITNHINHTDKEYTLFLIEKGVK